MLRRARGYRRLAAFLTLGYFLAVAMIGLGHRAPVAQSIPSANPEALAVVDFLPDGEMPVLCDAEAGTDHADHAYVCDACRIVDAPGLDITATTPEPAVHIEHRGTAFSVAPLFQATTAGPPLGSRAPPLLTA